jgi:hydroxyacylglutathione hydrolase
MRLMNIPAFRDNIIWVLSDQTGQCIIVDPGEATPVITALAQNQLTPIAILLSHHHADHVGGIAELVARYPHLAVYGPEETRCKGATHIVDEQDSLTLLNREFTVLSVPGHTLGHLAYYSAPYLFCGDTLFSAGCGRLFEGTYAQLFHSLQKLARLPEETLVCCAHEYTESNLRFALSIEPENHDVQDYLSHVIALKNKHLSPLPSTLQKEKKVNLFIRDIHQPSYEGSHPCIKNEVYINKINALKSLRERKNHFTG